MSTKIIVSAPIVSVPGGGKKKGGPQDNLVREVGMGSGTGEGKKRGGRREVGRGKRLGKKGAQEHPCACTPLVSGVNMDK